MSAAPTLELCDLAFTQAGSALGPALSLRSDSARLGLIGDWEPLFQALLGQAQIARGSARVLDCDLERALAEGVVGFAACDPTLPGSFTARQYLEHAARLTHGSRSRAARESPRTLERFGLAEFASRKLAELGLVQRRALGVAAASVTTPDVVCLETPLFGLDAPAADYIATLCLEASTQARTIVSVARPLASSAERTLLDQCEELFLNERGVLVAHGAPGQVLAGSGRYSIRVVGARLEEYAEALGRAGHELSPRSRPGTYLVQLAAGASTDALLDAALDYGLIVLELEPLLGAEPG